MKRPQFLKTLTLWNLNSSETVSYIVNVRVLTMQNYGRSQQIEETLGGAWHFYEPDGRKWVHRLAHHVSVDSYFNPHFRRILADLETKKSEKLNAEE